MVALLIDHLLFVYASPDLAGFDAGLFQRVLYSRLMGNNIAVTSTSPNIRNWDQPPPR